MDVDETNNGMGVNRTEKARVRAREMKDTALSAIADTPGWVWAVIGGVVLLVIGLVAASKMRGRYASHDDTEV